MRYLTEIAFSNPSRHLSSVESNESKQPVRDLADVAGNRPARNLAARSAPALAIIGGSALMALGGAALAAPGLRWGMTPVAVSDFDPYPPPDGQDAPAVALRRAELLQSPESADGERNLAIALYQESDPEAVEHFINAALLDPDNYYYPYVVSLLVKFGGPKAKVVDTAVRVSVEPRSAEAQLALAGALEKRGFAGAARRRAEMALRLKPGWGEAQAFLKSSGGEMKK
jgi:tetratricopeptide (TPR) repeat protein